MDQLQDAAWRHAVGLVLVEDLPMIAAEALADGVDCPSLRALAGLPRSGDADEVRDLFTRTFAELGRTAPDGPLAERYLLHHLATELVRGAITPKQVAAHVWYGMEGTETPEEDAFLGVAESFEDYLEEYTPDAFRDWETELRATAVRLADTAGPPDIPSVPTT